MPLDECEVLVRKLFKEYKISHYSFMYDRARVRLGRHSGHKKLITLSSWNVIHRDKERTLNTILHEIAHAIAYIKYGKSQHHNKNWKAIALSIGCKI